MRQFFIRSTFLVCLIGAFSCVQAQTPVASLGDNNRVSVCAHRGAHLNAPENSLLSFQHAIDMGCDLVEIDVRTSKDGHLVLMHDSTVDRTTNGKGRVDQLTFKQIRDLQFGENYPDEKVPTFDEALAFCKGKINVYIDNKHADPARIIAGVKKHGLTKHVVIYSSTNELINFKQLAPEIWITTPHPDTIEGDAVICTISGGNADPEMFAGAITEFGDTV